MILLMISKILKDLLRKITWMKYLIYLLTVGFINLALAEDLTRQKPIEKVVYFKGSLGIKHYYEPNKLIFTNDVSIDSSNFCIFD